MNRLVQITALLLLAAGVAVGAEVKSATLLLQEGIYAEETEGNLEKAIGIYEEAAKAAGESQKAAAEAVFRTGMCYLKKGDKTTAIKQFELVVTKFASQTTLASEAQKQLDSLRPNQTFRLPNEVMGYLSQLHAQTYAKGTALHIVPNSHIYAIDENFECLTGGLATLKNDTGATITGEMSTGIPSYPDYDYSNENGEKVKTRFVRSSKSPGAYDVFVTPDRPIEVNEVRYGSWIGRKPRQLSRGESGNYQFTMQNQLNVEGIEDFFLVVPEGTTIVKKSAEPVSQKTVAGFDIYQWQKHVQADTNNKVIVQLASSASIEAAKPLELGAVPWTDGEICKLSLKTNSGMPIGGLYYMPRLVKDGGKDMWQLDSYQFVTVQESRQFTRVEADAETFAPIAGRTINQMGDFVAAYDKDKVALATTMKGKMSTKEIPVSGPVFDNEQAIMLIRRLPLAEGYSTTFQIFTVQGGVTLDCPIEVVGKEEVSVPFGTGPCWKVRLAIYSGQIKALEHTLYFSADEKKLLMKYDAGSAVMELLEVSQAQTQTVVSDKETGVSFVVPAGWVAWTGSPMGSYKPYALIANEGLEAWACLAGSEAAGTSLDSVVDGDITTLKDFFKDYTPRAGSRTTITVDGVPAVYYAADYVDDEKAMVEHRTYLIKNGTVYWFVFRIEKDKFEANKAIYDGIVSSFTVADK